MFNKTQADTAINLQQEFAAICPFFASQHSYSYALSQENGHITSKFLLRSLTEVSAWI